MRLFSHFPDLGHRRETIYPVFVWQRVGQPGSVSLWTLGTTIPFHSILRNTIIIIIIILAHEARVM